MTKFRADGANLGKLIERARSRGVPLFRVEFGENCVRFRTKRAFTPTMIAILENMCYHKWTRKEGDNLRNTYRVEDYFNWKYALSRAALLVFALVFAAACIFVDGRVLEIRIASDDVPLVASLLEEYGIKQGGKVQDIKDVENFLNRRLDARYVFVRQQGVRLSVEVWARDGQPLEVVQDSIYAPCDGVVQSVILLSGTSRVKAGDEVRAGDLLIEGRIASENGGEITCRAAGQVFLECETVREFEYETVRRSPFRTGRRESYTQVDLLFGVYGKVRNPFEDFETVTSESVLSSMFPVKIMRVDVFEIGWLEETIDFDKVKDFVIAEKTAEAVRESENEVLSSRAEVSGEEGTRTIRIFLRTLVKCGGSIGNQNI